jgi:hypothetical protein
MPAKQATCHITGIKGISINTPTIAKRPYRKCFMLLLLSHKIANGFVFDKIDVISNHTAITYTKGFNTFIVNKPHQITKGSIDNLYPICLPTVLTG